MQQNLENDFGFYIFKSVRFSKNCDVQQNFEIDLGFLA